MAVIISTIIFCVILYMAINEKNKKDAAEIVDKILTYFDYIKQTDTILNYNNYWELIERENIKLSKIQKKLSKKLRLQIQDVVSSVPASNSEDYQWYLRNTIDRQKDNVIRSIKTTYKNSRAHKQAEYEKFCAEIQNYSSTFNEETGDFANTCIDEVCYALGGISSRRMPAQDDYASYQRSLLTPSLRYDILKRDGFRCTICGRGQEDGVKLHVDHIKPVSKGGETTPSNLRTLCQDCNLGKSDKYDEESEN